MGPNDKIEIRKNGQQFVMTVNSVKLSLSEAELGALDDACTELYNGERTIALIVRKEEEP